MAMSGESTADRKELTRPDVDVNDKKERMGNMESNIAKVPEALVKKKKGSDYM